MLEVYMEQSNGGGERGVEVSFASSVYVYTGIAN